MSKLGYYSKMILVIQLMHLIGLVFVIVGLALFSHVYWNYAWNYLFIGIIICIITYMFIVIYAIYIVRKVPKDKLFTNKALIWQCIFNYIPIICLINIPYLFMIAYNIGIK